MSGERFKNGDIVYSTMGRGKCKVICPFGHFSYKLEDNKGNVFYSDESCLEKHRTFEEIVNELRDILAQKNEYISARIRDRKATITDEEEDVIEIWNDGYVSSIALKELDAGFIAAISSACTELSAKFEAEHGKEEK